MECAIAQCSEVELCERVSACLPKTSSYVNVKIITVTIKALPKNEQYEY